MALGTGRWRWAYEATMVALAVAVVALLPLEDTGWVRIASLTIWGLFVADYFTRLGLSTDWRGFVRRNVIDLLAILPADFFRVLRVLRLARLLRMLRAGSILWRVTRDLRGVTGTNGLGWVLLVSLITILGGGVTGTTDDRPDRDLPGGDRKTLTSTDASWAAARMLWDTREPDTLVDERMAGCKLRVDVLDGCICGLQACEDQLEEPARPNSPDRP